MQALLEIYFEEDCRGCKQARKNADHVKSHLPQIHVSVIDISDNVMPLPEKVFAVPMYLFNGQMLYLGNSGEKDLVVRLENLIGT